MDKRLENYVDVAQRIKLFYEKYPDGSLQMDSNIRFEIIDDQVLAIGQALAYRNSEDKRPGIGTAQEYLPGKTAFTRGSEIQNLETSCWGRAIGALGIGIDKSIATRQEVELAIERNKPEEVVKIKRANPKIQEIVELLRVAGVEDKQAILTMVGSMVGRAITNSEELTAEEIALVLAKLQVVEP